MLQVSHLVAKGSTSAWVILSNLNEVDMSLPAPKYFHDYGDKGFNRVIDSLIDEYCTRIHNELTEDISDQICSDHSESPIEQIMLAALLTANWQFWHYVPACYTNLKSTVFVLDADYPNLQDLSDEDIGSHCVEYRCVNIIKQYRIGQYRTDLAIFTQSSDPNRFIKIAIECDGHDYHERTKEQASRDKKRDRYFQMMGWPILRFTGSEIYKDPAAKAQEVMDLVEKML
jgi:very-short-patch-repair endonuclease